MKKVFMGMFAIATMLLATSCSEDELIAQSSGNEVSASFKVSVRSDVKTKAVGDDTEGIDQLIFAVYDENGKELPALRQSTHPTEDGCTNTTAISLSNVNEKGQRTATINVTLVKGQTYSFAFWAQNKAYTAYSFDPDAKLVSVNYGQTANNKNADAFFANETLTVSGSFEKDITLKRPFAQVNFLTTGQDILDARNAGFDPKTSSIVVKNAATSLNVLDGTVTGSTEATFNLANLIENTETTTIKDAQGSEIEFETSGVATNFQYLATAYFLTGAASTTIDASMNVVAEDNGKMDLSVSGVNAQRNFRTNIYGNLLTSGGKFNVTVDPGFDGDYSVEVEEETVTYDKLSDALTANIDNTDALTYNVEAAGEQHSVSIEIPAGTSAASLTFSLEDLADNATISVSNAAGGNYDKPVVIEVPEGVNLGALTVDVPNAHVTLKQGSYTTVVSTTSSTTLEVGAGTTIGTLTVKQGNVRIAEGGKVETIANSTEGTLYIINAGGTLSTTLPENTIVIYEDTKHIVVLNDTYSANNMSDLMSYNKDVLKDDVTLKVSKGIYAEVVDVTGGKNITIQPKTTGEEVTIAGLGHQSNGTPSTVTVKSITFDNSITPKGWFTGTAQNIAPCVGAWGGNLTFEGCKFIVAGTSGKETGVMTWWTTSPALSFVFNDCEFEGKEDHANARAMQIYGNVNMEVNNCTFNTKKDYTLKYVAEEGNVAIFNNNTVHNSENFVELGSSAYPGSKYTVKINDATLGEGVSPYVIANEEDQLVYIDGVCSVSTSEQLAYAVNQGITTINLADGEYDVYGCGGKTLTINGSKDAVLKLKNEGEDGCDYAFGGNGTGIGNITFNGITINTLENTGNYKGFAYMKGTFNDCNFVGAYSLNNANDFVFNNCTFDFQNGYFWTWGANSVKFDGCTFNGNTKNILAHGYASTAITINNCQFAATEVGKTGAGDVTACVEIDPAGTNTYTINFTGNNTKTEYYAGWTRIKDGSTGHTITGVQ